MSKYILTAISRQFLNRLVAHIADRQIRRFPFLRFLSTCHI